LRKVEFLVFTLAFALLFWVSPLVANAVTYTNLEINEEIIPGEGTTYLTATGVQADGVKQMIQGNLVWKSSDVSIATITKGGRLEFSGKGGMVTISVYKGGVSGKKTIHVEPWVKSIDIENSLAYSSEPYRLVLKGCLSDGSVKYFGSDEKVVWSTSNPWVAWVNSQGIVTFTGEEGYVSVKAAYKEFSNAVNTTVDNEDDTVAWIKGIKIKEDIKYAVEKQKLTLVAIMSDESEKVIASESADWVSSDKKVLMVNNEGEITFTGVYGVSKIEVSYGRYDYETVVKVGRFLKSISINQSLNFTSAWVDEPRTLSVTGIYNDGTKMIQTSDITWSVSNSKVANITEEGIITFTGEAGEITIIASGRGCEGELVKDSVTVEVPVIEKSLPKRLYINNNPIGEKGIYSAQVICIYNNGERKDVTKNVKWYTSTPETVSIYEEAVYFSANPGKVELTANYGGLSDTISGYNNLLGSIDKNRICRVIIKEHKVYFSFIPVKLTGLAILGDGTNKDVTSQLKWYSNQPSVATIKEGTLVFTGRLGKARITAQGLGFRDGLEVEVFPEDLRTRIDKLEIEGDLSRGANQLRAWAYYNDNTVLDVTKLVVWNTSNKNVAVVSRDGNVMFPKGFDSVIISASYGGKSAEVKR